MEQPATILPPGTKIRTHARLLDRPELPGERAPNVNGTIIGVLPGFGGDVYRVQQDNGGVGSYCWDEFELETRPPSRRFIPTPDQRAHDATLRAFGDAGITEEQAVATLAEMLRETKKRLADLMAKGLSPVVIVRDR